MAQFLASCFGGRFNVPNSVVIPNPEDIGNNTVMLHDIEIDRLDFYIYPVPTETNGGTKSEEELQKEMEDRVRSIMARIIDPVPGP